MSETRRIDGFTSVVMVAREVNQQVEAVLTNAHNLFSGQFEDHEIILLAQPLEASNIEMLEAVLRRVPGIRFLMFSTKVPRETALAAGLEQAIGDFVVLMDPYADPADVAHPAVETCCEGTDVVYGVAGNLPQGVAYRLVSPLLHRLLLKMLGFQFPRNATGLMCLSRRAANDIMRTGRFHQTFEMRVARSGYRTAVHEYVLRDEKVIPRKGVLSSLRRGIRQLVFNSTVPLRWISGLGIMGSAASMAFAVYSLFVRLLIDRVVEGWTSLVLMVSFLSFLMFCILGLLGEYFGRMLDELSGHEHYHLFFEKHSSVMLVTDRLNVLSEPSAAKRNKV